MEEGQKGETYEFNRGDTYWGHCHSCKTSGLHYYCGLQEGFGNIPEQHQGTCGGCNTTKTIPLPLRTLQERLS